MKPLQFLATTTMLLSGAAHATSVDSYAFGANGYAADIAFNDRCNQGSSNVDCEFAVGELRYGNDALNGDRELGINNPDDDSKPFTGAEGDFDWTSGQSYEFSFGYTAATQLLSLTLDGTTIDTSSVSGGVDLAGAKSLFIRTRNKPGEDFTTLSDLELNGHAIPGAAVFDPSSVDVQYLQVFGFDLADDWELTGDITMTWDGTASGSNPAAQFKVTYVVPIPLPVGAWLMLTAVGGFGFAGWRRQCAAA